MSHYSDQEEALSFGAGSVVTPAAFSRQFKWPSFALLNACGTGDAQGSSIIAQLNRKGFSSVVATSMEVDAEMAADFLRCFASKVEGPKGETAPIGIIFRESVACMKTHYPVLRHSYMLLGDPSTPVCRAASL